MEVATGKLHQLLLKYEETKVPLSQLNSVQNVLNSQKLFTLKYKWILLIIILFALFLLYYSKSYVNTEECLLDMPIDAIKFFRPPESCDFCKEINEIPKKEQLTPDEFEKNYAYTAAPVIITDATTNWTAINNFDFWYFKDVYQKVRRKIKTLNCQFFPYKSGFKNFFEALEMPEDRAKFKSGTKPWYFGWSNCNNEVAEILRKHYSRPYFLPKTSENKPTDWIFMGGPGLGAHMHVDNVRLPSWQAQLRGQKEWILAPPPECYFHCRFLRTIVKKGEIIVVDTNKWYHKTNVLPGELSVTVGAEYD